MSDLYEKDFYQWTIEQGALLRARKLDEADIDNLAEEIESVGRGLQDELGDRMADLLGRMLVWKYRPVSRTQDLQSSLGDERISILGILKQSPSLHECIPVEVEHHSYDLAKIFAARDMDVDESTFPATCPWTFEEIMAFDIKSRLPANQAARRAARQD